MSADDKCLQQRSCWSWHTALRRWRSTTPLPHAAARHAERPGACGCPTHRSSAGSGPGAGAPEGACRLRLAAASEARGAVRASIRPRPVATLSLLDAVSHGPAGRRVLLGRATLDGLPVSGTTVMVRLACQLGRAWAGSADLSFAEKEGGRDLI